MPRFAENFGIIKLCQIKQYRLAPIKMKNSLNKLHEAAEKLLALFPSSFPIECELLPLEEIVAKPRKKEAGKVQTYWVNLYICRGRQEAVNSLPKGAATGWGEWTIGMPLEELPEELQSVIPKGTAKASKSSKATMAEWIAAAKRDAAKIS